MNQKQRKKVAIVLLIGIVVVGLLMAGGFRPFAVATSLIVESVTSLEIISNEQDLDKSFFRIAASVGRGAEEIVGSVSDSQFNQALRAKGNEAWKTNFDLTFSAEITNEEAIYPISPQSTGVGLFKLYGVQRKIDPGLFRSPPPCEVDPISGGEIILDIDFNRGDRFCIIANHFGKFGDLESPNIKTDVAFEMNRLGSTISGVLSNIGTDSGLKELRDGSELVGRVRLSQVAQTAGANPPNPANFKGLFMFGDKWKLIRESDVESYKNFRDSLEILRVTESEITEIESACGVLDLERRNACLFGKVHDFIIGVEPKQNTILISEERFADGSIFFENENSETNSKIRYSPSESQLTEPRIVLDVQAKWIGVRSLVSEPKITNLLCEDFTQTGAIKVSVKNNGQVASRFGVKLDSCGVFEQITETITKPISAQDTKDFFISIDSEGLEKIETCTVTAFNTELPQTLKDTKSISCKSLEVRACEDGDQILTKIDDLDCVKECVEGKFPQEASFCCEFGVRSEIVDSKVNYECIGNKTDPPIPTCVSCDEFAKSKMLGAILPSQKCKKTAVQNTLFCVFSFVKLFLVPVVLIFATLFGFQFFQTNTKIPIKNKGAAFLVSLILAGILAAITFYLFWVGVIAFVIYIALTFVLKFGGVRGVKRKFIG